MICTFKTSARLKKNGFPQPPLAPGQTWYEPDGTPVIMIGESKGFIRGSNRVLYGNMTHMILAFAPTPEDIMRELGALPGVCFKDTVRHTHYVG